MFHPDTLPPDLAAALAAVRALGAHDPAAMSAEERAAWVLGMQQLKDAAAAVDLGYLASFDTHGDGELLHAARSTTAWLNAALHISGSEASKRCGWRGRNAPNWHKQ